MAIGAHVWMTEYGRPRGEEWSTACAVALAHATARTTPKTQVILREDRAGILRRSAGRSGGLRL
jgi:hypothetical protein